MQLGRRYQRGDTIIEVLFAITVFAMVAVGSLSIMNQGTGSAQRSLEVTLVREQIDAQAQAIRYIHQAYVAAYQKGVAPTGIAAEWITMTDKSAGKGKDAASTFGLGADSTCAMTDQKPFILNARKAVVSAISPTLTPPANGTLPPFAQVAYNADSTINQAYGIWIEAVPTHSTDGPGFVDFHIRACWDSPGANVPVTLGTIVRLYEPQQ